MSLQPLPQAVLTAAKLREEAKRLLLMADELEQSALHDMPQRQIGPQFRHGEILPRKRERRRKC